MNNKRNIVLEKASELAIRIVQLTDKLNEHSEFVIAKQILRCGTSVGANIKEANNSETKKDFAHKMNIAQKECAETAYWIELLIKSGKYPDLRLDPMLDESMQILYLLKAIIKTTRVNIKKESTRNT